MEFFDESLFQDGGKTKNNSIFSYFIKLSQEYQTVIQILEPKITEKNIVWRHYIPQALRKSGKRGVPILCPGVDVCPVCRQNYALGDRKHPDYIPSQKRIAVNVLDLTPSTICPVCETENYTTVCSYCGENLSGREFKPSDTVKILERGVTLFRQIAALEEVIRAPYDPQDPLMADKNAPVGVMVPVGITRFPITLVSSRDGKGDLIVTPIPGPVNKLNYLDYQDKLISIAEAYFVLQPDEIKLLMDGGSLSDVLKARKEPGDSGSSTL